MVDRFKEDNTDKFPSAISILLVLIAIMSVLTWIVPSGSYERVFNETLGKNVPVPGTYQLVDATPQSIFDALKAPIVGFYEPIAYTANAIDVALFILVIGGFLGVVNATNAIETGIFSLMRRLVGREIWMIPILLGLFAIGGSTYGMTEEALAFCPILIPVMVRAGYDAITGVALVLIGTGLGVAGSTINPFATVIASNAASISFTEGFGLRLAILLCGWVLCSLFLVRHAHRVKTGEAAPIGTGVSTQTSDLPEKLSHRQIASLMVFAVAFATMIWGVSSQGWWMAEMSALFIAASIVAGFTGWLGEKRTVDAFISGAKDVLGVALVIGLARGIVAIMDAGQITDTFLHFGEQALEGATSFVFINTMFGIEMAMSFLVPSSSGLAVLSMPVLGPLSDFAGVDRHLTVTAFQAGSGLIGIISPSAAIVVGALTMGRIGLNRWLRFIWPLLAALIFLVCLMLSVAAKLA